MTGVQTCALPIYLEYDDAGEFIEWDPANGNEVEIGVIEKPEKEAA